MQYASLNELEVHFSLCDDNVLLKQLAGLKLTTSYITYDLNACTYLASKVNSHDEVEIHFRVDETIKPIAFIDRSINPILIPFEIRMVEKSSIDPLSQAGWKMDMIIPRSSENGRLIPQLIRTIKGRQTQERSLTDRAYLSAQCNGLEFEMVSVTLSNQDLDQLEALDKTSTTPSSAVSPSASTTRDPGHDKKSRSTKKRPCHQPTIPLLSTPSRQRSNNLKVAEQEKAKTEQWNEIQNTWQKMTLERVQGMVEDDRKRLGLCIPTFSSWEAGWADFATARGAKQKMLEDRRAPNPRETGGYMQDPNRDYSRSDGPVRPSAQTTRKGRHKRAAGRSFATFNPPTNLPKARSSPDQRG